MKINNHLSRRTFLTMNSFFSQFTQSCGRAVTDWMQRLASSRCDMVLCASQYLLIILFLLQIVHFSPFPRLYHLSLKSGEILPSK